MVVAFVAQHTTALYSSCADIFVDTNNMNAYKKFLRL